MIILRTLEDDAFPLKDTAVALGMFDGVHRGHMEVLHTAAEMARQQNLTPCAFTFALSQPRPNFKRGAKELTDIPTLEKLLEEQGMEYVFAPCFPTMRNYSPEEYVSHVLHDTMGAKVVCCGENFTFAKGGKAGTDDLIRLGGELGIEVKVLPLLEMDGDTVSSTRIRALIEGGKVAQAAKLLGRHFTIDFAVVQGNRIGRTLGTPTINQPFPEEFVVPRFGVYATIACVDGTFYSGVTNVGVKPTVGSDTVLAETYIQGFSGDLYGREIEVAFLEFIRPEMKFDSLEELRENIMRNADTAARIARPFLVGQH